MVKIQIDSYEFDDSDKKPKNKIDDFAENAWNKINDFAERWSILFKRKIYNQLLQWNEESNGKTALLVEGARRVGKSTIVEEFVRNEYESYIIVDFYRASSAKKKIFDASSNIIFICIPHRLQH